MFKRIWPCIAVISVIVATALTHASVEVSVASVIGVLFVLAVAFKKSIAPLLGAVLSLMYGLLSYHSGFYANAAMNLFLLVPLQLWGWYHWMNNKHTIVELSPVNKLWISGLTIAGMIIATCLAIIHGSHLPLLDGPSSVLVITGTILLSLKTKEQWPVWIVYNLIEIVMWFFAASIEPSVFAIFIMRLVFF
ncbi:nicotinamide riboside transporter PnuC, partial [Herbiconiux daphne]